MREFYIDVALRRGITRIRVEEVSPEGWAVPGSLQFIIRFPAGSDFLTLPLQLEGGTWYDRNTRLSAEDYLLGYVEAGPDEFINPDDQSPLNAVELRVIGVAVSDDMMVGLTGGMVLFIPQYHNPAFN